jgi:hypothetical protein
MFLILTTSCAGRAHNIVVAERVVLNFMQRMSGIATLTKVLFFPSTLFFFLSKSTQKGGCYNSSPSVLVMLKINSLLEHLNLNHDNLGEMANLS